MGARRSPGGTGFVPFVTRTRGRDDAQPSPSRGEPMGGPEVSGRDGLRPVRTRTRGRDDAQPSPARGEAMGARRSPEGTGSVPSELDYGCSRRFPDELMRKPSPLTSNTAATTRRIIHGRKPDFLGAFDARRASSSLAASRSASAFFASRASYSLLSSFCLTMSMRACEVIFDANSAMSGMLHFVSESDVVRVSRRSEKSTVREYGFPAAKASSALLTRFDAFTNCVSPSTS